LHSERSGCVLSSAARCSKALPQGIPELSELSARGKEIVGLRAPSGKIDRFSEIAISAATLSRTLEVFSVKFFGLRVQALPRLLNRLAHDRSVPVI
jgi:hypothetical protein